MKTLLALSTAAATALLIVANSGCTSTADANARKPAGGATDIFKHLDANHDGKVTYAEFDAGFADTVFATYNRNSDGAVTHQEWDGIERANQDKTENSFHSLDRNHDGKLTREELMHHSAKRNAVVRRLFNRIDKNHDGVITLEEARTFGIQTAAERDPANHP